MRRMTALLAGLLLCMAAGAQNIDPSVFKETIRATDSLMRIHSGARCSLKLNRIQRKGKTLVFTLADNVSDYPIRPGDNSWLASTIKSNLPEAYSSYNVDVAFRSYRMSELEVSAPGNGGAAPSSRFRMADKRTQEPLVSSGIKAPKGLEGRHIAIWQSHGRYFNHKLDDWMWQRARIFQIVEDLSTQSYVVPFLVPMLENAGANVMLPRERDWHKAEIIVDNDPCETSSSRTHGTFATSGRWTSLNPGFADACEYYTDNQNPFAMGTSLKCSGTSRKADECTASWTAEIPAHGEYAVYTAYRSTKDSSTGVRYTIHTAGGDRTVTVNQRMGGGTWVYLGSYEFAAGQQKLVTVSNFGAKGTVIADAVKIGGGMGNIARRAPVDSSALRTSGVPRFAEGARYHMQWSGIPEAVWSQNEGADDYRDDFMSRGTWVKYLAGGSWVNPKEEGLGIPVDLSLAFHTDAGTRADDSIVGTLAIYTRLCEKSRKLPSGGNRDTCRELTDLVQTQVCGDIREKWDTLWTRRQLWNRSYSESRTTGVPAILLELLSHQNFEDMKYGLDPAFRFDVSRACYKAILKYVSMHYGCPYVVQPLPVQAFSATLIPDNNEVLLRWKPTEDSLEPTATPTSYRVYTRVDGSGWDAGREVAGDFTIMPVERGHIYSYKVVAVNSGGYSFPSEILSAGLAGERKVRIVNNFTRISGPTWFDSPTYAGFDNGSDSGVPYMYDWSFIGPQKEFNRAVNYENDSKVGFGFSDESYADKVVAGNSFDYPYIHGLSLMAAGCSFDSCSSAAFSREAESSEGCWAIDLICGKQCTVRTANRSGLREGVFPAELQDAISLAAMRGCNIIISGSYIASDCFSSIYPIDYTPAQLQERMRAQQFVSNVLGYSLCRSHGTNQGSACSLTGTTVSFPQSPVFESYCVESPDALYAFKMGSEVYMHYPDTKLPAAVKVAFPSYRVAAFGFPLETVDGQQARDAIFSDCLKYFEN